MAARGQATPHAVTACLGSARPRRAVGHDLAALDQPVLLRTVVGDGLVERSQIVPHQHIALIPEVGVEILLLKLVREQKLEEAGALRGIHPVDDHRVAGIRVERALSGDRVGDEDRMRHGRPLAAALR